MITHQEEYKIWSKLAEKHRFPVDVRYSVKNEWYHAIYWATNKGKITTLEEIMVLQKNSQMVESDLIDIDVKELVHRYYKNLVTQEHKYGFTHSKSRKNLMQKLEGFLGWQWQWNHDYESAIKSLVYSEDSKAVDYLLKKINHPQKYNMVLYHVIRGKKHALLPWALSYPVTMVMPSIFVAYTDTDIDTATNQDKNINNYNYNDSKESLSSLSKNALELQQKWLEEKNNLLTEKFYELSEGMVSVLYHHFKHQLSSKDCKKLFENLIHNEYLEDARIIWDDLLLNQSWIVKSWIRNTVEQKQKDYQTIYPAKEKGASLEALIFLEQRGFYDDEIILRNLYHYILSDEEEKVLQIFNHLQLAKLDYTTPQESILRLEYLEGAIFQSNNPVIWQAVNKAFFSDDKMLQWTPEEQFHFSEIRLNLLKRNERYRTEIASMILDTIAVNDLKVLNEKCSAPFYHFLYDYRLKRELNQVYPLSEQQQDIYPDNQKNTWKV
jgi:hypothetical protein